MSAKVKNYEEPATTILQDAMSLVGCAGGIYTCYLVYGMIHETIYKTTYGDGEKFTYSLFLVGFQSIVNGLWAFLGSKLSPETKKNTVPQSEYFKIAFSYIFAMLASNTALQFIAYPTQVLAKSVKMIPVMLMRIVTVNQKYKLRDYLCVLLITFGIAVFVFKPNKNNGQEDSLLGYGLCLVSLFLDGYTGPTQEALRKQYSPSVNQLMFHLNKFAVLIVFVALVLTNQLLPSLDFIARYPEVITKMLVFSCLSAVGQYLILMTLFRFNSLVLTTITTTRKFFTILISVLWFGNQLTDLQWVGVCFVFSGLLYNGYCKYLDKLEKTAAKANSNKAESIDLESKTK